MKQLIGFIILVALFINISAYECPLVIVIPSYNNSVWYEKNLESVFSQKYQNYRIIYIDDCSSDGTYELVKQYVDTQKQEHRVTLIRNMQRQGALSNHYRAVWLCEDYEVIVQLDGDDWFAHEQVLDRINTIYQDPEIWITYGQYEVWPSKKAGIAKLLSNGVIRKIAYRESEWVTSALRTFKAGLFKRIQLQDLLTQGTFFPTTCDFAFMLPMLEMADGRTKFIDEVLYIYNCKTQFNDYKRNLQKQLATEYFIRSRRKYKPLESLEPIQKNQAVEMLIFYQGNTNGLSALLASVNGLIVGLHHVTVIGDYSLTQEIQKLQIQYPQVQWITTEKQDFKKKLVDHITQSYASYLVCAADGDVVTNFIDLNQNVAIMEKSGAYCFSYVLGKNITKSSLLARSQKQPSILAYDCSTCAWQFKDGEYDWANPHRLTVMLYKKDTLLQAFNEMYYDSFATCKTAYERYPYNPDMVGLCYEHSCVLESAQGSFDADRLINPYFMNNNEQIEI